MYLSEMRRCVVVVVFEWFSLCVGVEDISDILAARVSVL